MVCSTSWSVWVACRRIVDGRICLANNAPVRVVEEQERSIKFNRKLGGERLFLILVGDGWFQRESSDPIYFAILQL